MSSKRRRRRARPIQPYVGADEGMKLNRVVGGYLANQNSYTFEYLNSLHTAIRIAGRYRCVSMLRKANKVNGASESINRRIEKTRGEGNV